MIMIYLSIGIRKLSTEKVEYDPTAVILDRLDKLNLDIAAKMKELRGLIGE